MALMEQCGFPDFNGYTMVMQENGIVGNTH